MSVELLEQKQTTARTITTEERREIIAAASMASPIGETEMQAFGSKTAWGQNVRPGRCEARRKFLCMMLRASELALAERPELEIRHVIAAIRSHALNTADLLVCPRTGKWLSKPNAVKSRGLELAGTPFQFNDLKETPDFKTPAKCDEWTRQPATPASQPKETLCQPSNTPNRNA